MMKFIGQCHTGRTQLTVTERQTDRQIQQKPSEKRKLKLGLKLTVHKYGYLNTKLALTQKEDMSQMLVLDQRFSGWANLTVSAKYPQTASCCTA